MQCRARRLRTQIVLVVTEFSLVVSLSLLLVIQSSLAAEPDKNATGQSPTAKYVGADVCKTCHEEIYKKHFELTPHFQTTLEGGHGCESCHGPGSEHVEGSGDITKIIRFSTLSTQEASARCLSCHGDKLQQRHFAASAHASNDVGCL